VDAGLAFPLLESLSKLWLLGDRLSDSKFRNTVMDATIDVIEWLDPLSADFTAAFPPELTTLIWSATSPGKAMRRLVVDFYAYMVPPGDMEPLWENVHASFLKDLTMRSLDFGQSEGRNVHAALRDLCTYHEHGEQDRECQSAECSWESVMSTMAPQT
jgi:hypothetical protein